MAKEACGGAFEAGGKGVDNETPSLLLTLYWTRVENN